jgi:hypothetical protein
MRKYRTVRLATLIVTLVAVAGLAGCGTPVRTFSEADDTTNFSGIRTYAWRDASGPAAPAEAASPEVSALTLQAIRTAVEAELSLRGLKQGPQPDALVAVRAGSRDRLRTTFWGRDPFFYGDRYGRYPPWPITERRTVDTYEENLVAIDVFDARTAKAIWSGIGATTLPLSAEDRESVDIVVAETLKDFPPGWAR